MLLLWILLFCKIKEFSFFLTVKLLQKFPRIKRYIKWLVCIQFGTHFWLRHSTTPCTWFFSSFIFKCHLEIFFNIIYFACVSEKGGQRTSCGNSVLVLCRFQGSNLVPQIWWQVNLPTELSCWSRDFHLSVLWLRTNSKRMGAGHRELFSIYSCCFLLYSLSWYL